MKRRKAFTIVELVIVIGVIGILSAILIPTFVNLTEKAKLTNDISFVKNLNLILSVNEADDPSSAPKTMSEAVDQGRVANFDVPERDVTRGHAIIYDSVARRFALVKDDLNPNAVDMDKVILSEGTIQGRGIELWKCYSAMPANQNYSIYARENFSTANITDLKVGFDEGNASVESVAFNGTESGNQTVILRTFDTDLTINAPEDTVIHYEWVKNLTVTAVAPSTYIERGYVEKLVSFSTGRFVADYGARFHQQREAVLSKLSAVESEFHDLVPFSVPRYEIPSYDEDAVFMRPFPPAVAGDYVAENEEPVPMDSGDDANDLSALYGAFAGIRNYTSETISYMTEGGCYQYYRHLQTNYVQHKYELFTENSYYVYPEESFYLGVCNFGYVNFLDNCTSFALSGGSAEARLATELVRANLKFVQKNATYQDRMFTLEDLTESFLSGMQFSRVGKYAYECTFQDNKPGFSNAAAFQQMTEIIAPNFRNNGYYMLTKRIRIELNHNEGFRLRLYASPVESGKFIPEHKDEEKPEWQYLFAEALITDVGTSEFHPTARLLTQGH